jgi:regulator of sigma E protease
MWSMLFSNVYVALVVVAFFGITIFIHELGHYLVARWCGLKVEVFAIGFGPALWKKTVNGIKYKIGCIPFGGYVALPQLDPTAMQTVQGSDKDESAAAGGETANKPLPPVAPWKKILVSLAGATGNLLLAIVIAWLVYWIGMPASTVNQDTVLGYVAPNTVLYRNGVRIGDRVTSVNGRAVDQWSHFIQESAMADEVTLEIARADGSTVNVTTPTMIWRYGIRMVDGVDAQAPVLVGSVDAGMSAAAAGVESGDRIIAFDGKPVFSIPHLILLVDANRDRTVGMTVQRRIDGGMRELTLSVTPAHDEKHKQTRIGIGFKPESEKLDTSVKVHPEPMTQIRHHSSMILRFLRDLVNPRKAKRAATQVGGPVAIITQYFNMIQASFMLAVWFTGFLNINLAIINLLPLPVLDGGHIVFSIYEWIFRRPIHARVINILVNAFAILLIGVFLLLSFRDVGRTSLPDRIRYWFGKEASEAVEEPVTEPPVPGDGE